ncbi:hypothetical protein L7F22_019444 [Adiantum nelumboides]|nr:hypothetical protein [Adiantum nelumboides]
MSPTFKTALFIIDVQVDLAEKADSEVPDAEAIREALNSLIKGVRDYNHNQSVTSQKVQLIFVQHNDRNPKDPLAKGKSTWELVFKPKEEEGDWYISKDVRDTFESNPDLIDRLNREGIEHLVMSGLQSDYCVRSTTLGAINGGFQHITLLSGVHSTYPYSTQTLDQIKNTVEEELKQKGVRILPWKEWLAKLQ